MSSDELTIHPVILSGGSGSRLWPSSRPSLPKQFIEFRDMDTLFGDTISRVNTSQDTQLTIVSNKTHNFLGQELSETRKKRHPIYLRRLAGIQPPLF